MQFAISGIYKGGQIILNETLPNNESSDEPCDVMVAFLPKQKAIKSKRKTQLGILSAFKADPTFYDD